MQYLRLIRWGNLAMLALIQCLLYYCLIYAVYDLIGYDTTLNPFNFGLLVLSTVSIAAGGYIINDYFDIPTDQINKPQRITIGKEITPENAMLAYGIVTALGVALGIYLAWHVGNYRLAFWHIFAATALWFYSTSLQKTALIGNITVAVLSGLSVLLVMLYEQPLVESANRLFKNGLYSFLEHQMGLKVVVAPEDEPTNFILNSVLVKIFIGYALFAFLLTLIREIAKDGEDITGDRAAGYRTLPIRWGLGYANWLAAALCLLVIFLMKVFQANQLLVHASTPAIAAFILVQLPLLYVIYMLWRSKNKATQHRISQWLKGVMVGGLFYLPYFASTLSLQQTVAPPVGMEGFDIKFDTIYHDQIDSNAVVPNADTTAVVDTAALYQPIIKIDR